MTHLPPKRIMIFGLPGSGKSTVALHLSILLQLPLYHIDRYFFEKGWKERDKEEFMRIQHAIVEQDAWIVDGNATRSLEVRYSKADIVLYFRLNRLRCLIRVFKRLFSKDCRIIDRAEGCSERVSFGLIRYLWGFHRRVEKKIKEYQEKYPEVQFYELHTDEDVAQTIKRLYDITLVAAEAPKCL